MTSNGYEAETRFARPKQDLLDVLAAAAARNAGARSRSSGRWVESGSSAVVFVSDEVVVRISRQRAGVSEMRRSQALVDALPVMPFEVPRSVGETVEIDGHVAVPVRRLHGDPHPAGEGDPARLRDLLEAIHSVDVSRFCDLLAPARQFAGGASWEAVLREEVVPRLDRALRDSARLRIDALASLPESERSFNHGDLAGSNVLWSHGRVAGVLDWDLAAWDDPAEDVAALASWHGWSLLPLIADPGTAARAAVFRRSFPLQIIAFSIINDRPEEEISRAIASAQQRMSDDADSAVLPP